jgi:RHS repeat-associated protein
MRATAAPDLSSYSYSGTGYVTSDANMNVAQWFDYAPYGAVLATTNTGTSKAGRQYIGQFTDDSGLSYLNARYFSSRQGQFITQDPVFLALGNPNQLKQVSQQDQQQFLSDPQQLNSYSYGDDNPITRKDPDGRDAFRSAVEFSHLGITALETGSFVLFPNYNQTPEELNEQAFAAISGVVSSGVGYLAKGEGGYAISGGMLAVDADMAAYKYTCANIVHCQSYFNPPEHIELLSPGGPAIKIVPAQNGEANGPVSSRSAPTNGPTQPQQDSGGGQSGGSAWYAQQIASIQAQIASIQAQVNQIMQSRAQAK